MSHQELIQTLKDMNSIMQQALDYIAKQFLCWCCFYRTISLQLVSCCILYIYIQLHCAAIEMNLATTESFLEHNLRNMKFAVRKQRPACVQFLGIAFSTSVCVCVCVCAAQIIAIYIYGLCVSIPQIINYIYVISCTTIVMFRNVTLEAIIYLS